MSERTDAIRAALAAIDTAIAQAEAALRTADPDRTTSLTAMLVELRAQRTQLQFALINEEAAAVVVAPVAPPPAGMAGIAAAAAAPRAAAAAPLSGTDKSRLKKLRGELTGAATDQAVADVALKFATLVRDLSNTVLLVGTNVQLPRRKPIARKRAIGNNPTRPKRKTKPGR
jgi:hypothetical protein